MASESENRTRTWRVSPRTGSIETTLNSPLAGDLERAPAAAVDADRRPVPFQVDRRGLLPALDVPDDEVMVQAAQGRVAPLDGQGPAVLFGLEDLLDEGVLLGVGRDDAAAQDLGLRPVRVLGEEAVDRDLHVRPDDAEAELEPGEGLGQVEDLPDVEDGLVLLARLELALGSEDELALAPPLGLPGDGRRELEEPRGGRTGRRRGVDEEDPDRRPCARPSPS